MNLFDVWGKKANSKGSEERAQTSGLDFVHVVYLGCEKRREDRKDKLQIIFNENAYLRK